MKKQILFVDDETQILQGLKRMLRSLRDEWEMYFITGGKEAIEFMNEHPVDVIVSDMRMPGIDGAQLLTHVAEHSPYTVRIILSGQADKSQVLRSIEPSHQYLSKPCDADTLKTTILRASLLRNLMSDEKMSFISSMRSLPSLPRIYSDLVSMLRSPDFSITNVADLIKQDMGMTAKILQLVNSAYFGVSRTVSDPSMAVNLLGINTISSLVLLEGVFSSVSNQMLPSNFSLDAVWNHSGSVGKIAQKILKDAKKDKQDIDDALSAGLLHDCGKIIFADNLKKEYEEVIDKSIRENIALCEVEKEAFGVNHAEAGAYLLNLWGLPEALVEIVAFHHNPTSFSSSQSAALDAVVTANALIDYKGVEGGVAALDQLDDEYINKLGGKKALISRVDCS
ncbi:MAG: HDOD domain-containing protein [Deltaproteobacteria bacterium]|nr:HDOD domain-containing protein [Deltaproteobacteria bacterium]